MGLRKSGYNKELKNFKTLNLKNAFEERVQSNPQDICAIECGKKYTYRYINIQANKLAHYLKSNGVLLGEYVLILSSNNVKFLIAVLASVKVGAIYAPVSINTPQKRIQNIISQINPKFIIDTDNHIKNYNVVSKIINSEILDRLIIQKYGNENLSTTIDAECGLYIIFTSGSSGDPKGIVNSHRATMNRIYWAAEIFPVQKDDVGYQKTSINFVDHIAELYTPLIIGMPLLFPERMGVNDPMDIIGDIQKHKITRIVLTPSYLKTLVEYYDFNARKLKSLKYIFVSGEILSLELAYKAYDKLPKATLVNIYGSSEVSADASFFVVPRDKKIHCRYIKDLFLQSEQYIENYCKLRINKLITLPNIPISEISLDNLKINKLPKTDTYDAYLEKLVSKILPYAVNVSSPRFIGHMTSGLPNFNLELSKLLVALNQNLVKIETSKVFTLLERQVLGFLHKIFYNNKPEFYNLNTYDSNKVLGIITSNGSISNITALWIARNSSFPPDNNFEGIDKCGLHNALQHYGYSNAVILTSPLAHYSFKKAASLIGIGKDAVLHMPCKDNYEIDFVALERMILGLQKNKVKIIAIIGICGATETGSIDDLQKLYTISKKHNIHFHVDAAFGGPIVFVKEMRSLIKGISTADTITICGHKQLYLPLGISITLLRNPEIAAHIYTTANYQATSGSYDTGRYTIEGSRSAISLLLHASLNIIGPKGYGDIIRIGTENANYLRNVLKFNECFELLVEPQINIVNYRYIPQKCRNLKANEIDNHFIDECNNLLQTKQFELGKTFVSKTTIWSSKYAMYVVSLRVVLSNPLTSFEDINYVLQDQIEIAEKYIEDGDSFSRKENFLLKPLTVPIGKPIANTTIYILDEQQNQVDCGVEGEIHISGSCLSNGYFQDKILTSQKYISNPFYDSNGSILYKTGDMGRFLPDGNIEYLYRQDTQIKINGQRVNLLEIEAAINNFQHIKTSVVLCNDELSKNLDSAVRYLLAFIIWEKNISNRPLNDLIDSLGTILPDYMIPKKIIEVEDLPLNSSGKIDKAKLLELYVNNNNNVTVKKLSSIEETINKRWQNCFGEQRVKDIHDNFFSIGGNSILAMRLANALTDYFRFQVPVKFIYDYPTVYTQAKYIKLNKETFDKNYLMSQYLSNSQEGVLSYNQNALWKIYTQEHNTKIYNITIAHKLKNGVSINDVDLCIHYLLKKHRILRAYFKENKVGQLLHKIVPYSVNIMTQSIYEVNNTKELNRLIYEHSSSNFYPHNSVPIRVFYYKLLKNQSFYINIVVDHIIFDEWSKNILCNELNSLYIDLKNNGTLPELKKSTTIDYLHFATWQRNLGMFCHNQFAFWQKKLQKSKYFTIKPQSKATSKWLSQSEKTNRVLITQLRLFASNMGVSVYSVILSGFFLLLHKITKCDDIIIGITVANRNDTLRENMLGYFAHCLPIRISINKHDSISTFISKVMQEIILLQANQDIPLELMCKKFDLHYTNKHPIFSTTFNFLDLEGQSKNKNFIFGEECKIPSLHNTVEQEITQDTNDITGKNIEYIETIFNVSAKVSNDCLELGFVCDSDLFQIEEVTKFVQQYKNILEKINTYSRIAEI